jgi:hypothetical protein
LTKLSSEAALSAAEVAVEGALCVVMTMILRSLRDLCGRNARHIARVTPIEVCRRRRPRESDVTEA